MAHSGYLLPLSRVGLPPRALAYTHKTNTIERTTTTRRNHRWRTTRQTVSERTPPFGKSSVIRKPHNLQLKYLLILNQEKYGYILVSLKQVLSLKEETKYQKALYLKYLRRYAQIYYK